MGFFNNKDDDDERWGDHKRKLKCRPISTSSPKPRTREEWLKSESYKELCQFKRETAEYIEDSKHALAEFKRELEQPCIERRRIGSLHPVSERPNITGVQRMHRKLEQIEYLQGEMRAAANGLSAILTIESLANAYAQFQAEGGVSADGWRAWLDGKILRRRSQHKTKRHLRLVAVNKARASPPHDDEPDRVA